MTRRHRLNKDEVSPVIESLRTSLQAYAVNPVFYDDKTAEQQFRVWYRLTIHRIGCPDYPVWQGRSTVRQFLDDKMVPFYPMEVVA